VGALARHRVIAAALKINLSIASLSFRRIPVVSIVDDNESVREATRGLVRSVGFNAVTFASAEEFLQSDRVIDTSCLIADVQMPGLSGVELQARLIAQGLRVPIIFVTAFPDQRIRTAVLKAGAVGFLSKPFDAECLIDHLRKALSF
jgi:FixJ family two-component response regulator